MFNNNQQWHSVGSCFETGHSNAILPSCSSQTFFSSSNKATQTILDLKFCITCWNSLWVVFLFFFFLMSSVWWTQFHCKPKAILFKLAVIQHSKKHFKNSYLYLYLHIYRKKYVANLNMTVLKIWNSPLLSDMQK